MIASVKGIYFRQYFIPRTGEDYAFFPKGRRDGVESGKRISHPRVLYSALGQDITKNLLEDC
jgi:hypothetical protein